MDTVHSTSAAELIPQIGIASKGITRMGYELGYGLLIVGGGGIPYGRFSKSVIRNRSIPVSMFRTSLHAAFSKALLQP
jgi:hypothetical protein